MILKLIQMQAQAFRTLNYQNQAMNYGKMNTNSKLKRLTEK